MPAIFGRQDDFRTIGGVAGLVDVVCVGVHAVEAPGREGDQKKGKKEEVSELPHIWLIL